MSSVHGGTSRKVTVVEEAFLIIGDADTREWGNHHVRKRPKVGILHQVQGLSMALSRRRLFRPLIDNVEGSLQ